MVRVNWVFLLFYSVLVGFFHFFNGTKMHKNLQKKIFNPREFMPKMFREFLLLRSSRCSRTLISVRKGIKGEKCKKG